jgi:hypothetical protein
MQKIAIGIMMMSRFILLIQNSEYFLPLQEVRLC